MKTPLSPALIPAFLLVMAGGLYALEVPSLTGRVNDYAKLLTSADAAQIESYLAAIDQSGAAQIVLLTIPSLEGDSLEAYSIRVADEWSLGQGEKANGVLLLVSMAEKKIRIEVGYDLEGILTDAVSGYIIRTVIVPRFKQGGFAAGIAAGLEALGGVVTGEAEISPQKLKESKAQNTGGFPGSVFFPLFLLIFLLSRLGGYRRYRRQGMSFGTAFLMGTMIGGSRNRGRGFGSSSGGFGGGFSGGFGGGGSGFGGGGASGGW